MGGVDWTELALVSRVEQWIAAHPYLFIISRARLVRPVRAAATVTGMQALRNRDALVPRDQADLGRVPTGAFRLVDLNKPKAAPPERGGRPLVLPLRKVQSTFPSMITIGRTDNNDLVVPDEQVSKFHAFFRLVGDRVELSDAGSRNGTFVGDKKLVPKQMERMRPGDQVRFARLAFQLLDAPACWDWLVRAMDQWG